MSGTGAWYVASIDRAGHALIAGGALGGAAITALFANGGAHGIAALALTWLLASLATTVAIVAVAGIPWLFLHRANRRGPGAAALTGFALALGIAALVQLPAAPLDRYRLASALLTGLAPALLAAAIGMAMHRIAYRRLL
ncbi:hypothetical protein M9980_11590 [Sphingomonas donggukensis]|uniref:Uncharacterized protein n=1 Tax=Sphingomonas donggukensis TaxID=2949093 RepID=A0ABY4TS91_9SPHN|nr:hypothetical protein [Sphingomonas donggukensis]URW75183.1 hypothetical protein M9980_11590 [Sphingomonas donggukensis]